MKRIAVIAFTAVAALAAEQAPVQKGTRLEHHSWVEADRLLQPDSVVVVPVGAALKEHGPHLKLRNDLTLAEYFTDRVLAGANVVVTPPLTYHFYPAFLEYPGSTSLSLDTSRDMTVQVIRSLARYGPRRFYVLNTGISTARALQPAADLLAREGVLMHFTDFGRAVDRHAEKVRQQPLGSHADEIETSMMLYIDPAGVEMRLAAKDTAPASTPMRLNRYRGGTGTYSPSGVWGDATLATREKGQQIVEGVTATILQEIEQLRSAPLPAPQPAASGPAAAATAAPPPPQPSGGKVLECLPGAERDIKRVEAAFNASWNNRDHERLGGLWSSDGDLVHGDGTIEKGSGVITANRRVQFAAREYRSARHTVTFGIIRCITRNIAVVDGRWSLQGVTDAGGKVLPAAEGMATLVLYGADGNWMIEAYRYNTKPGGPVGPVWQKRPGLPDKQ